ncbi:MAG: class I SAM-dependent methyltransferase [Candidatus Nanohaloarchaea archaeon]
MGMREEVRKGYEEGDYPGEYRGDREVRGEERELFEQMFREMPENSPVLDLGCGNGLPFDRFLVDEGFEVTGVDIAEKHVSEARENVPEAEFLQGDFFDQDFGPGSFDAVVSFYAIFHIPREEHGDLFEKMHHWLKDSGLILVTVGGGEGFEEMRAERDFIGSEMVWSSPSQRESIELIEEAGFEILDTHEEKSENEHHLWVLAQKQD